MQKHAPMATRMSPPAYAAMKLRLRSLLQNWGLWTDDELEEVATFVERDAVSFAVQVKAPESPPQAKSRPKRKRKI